MLISEAINIECTLHPWLKNIYKLLITTDADVLTGPQLYGGKNKKNYTSLFEKKYKKKL